MAALRPSNEHGSAPLATRSVAGGESMSEAIVGAFRAVNVDAFSEDTTLQEWVDTDALEGFEWSSDRPVAVSTRIWGHDVVVTAEAVRIYPDPAAD